MAGEKNFNVKNGLSVGGVEVINSSGDLVAGGVGTAVQEAIAVAKKQGYDVDEDDWSDKVATGPKKPSKDKTNRYSIKLTKNGKPTRKFLQIQVYNMGAKYELNCYVQ